MASKVCPTCHIEKDFQEFGKDRSHSDGHKSNCRKCRNIGDREPARPTLSEEEILQRKAQTAAVIKLIENHSREYRQLVARHLLDLNAPKRWRNLGAQSPSSETSAQSA